MSDDTKLLKVQNFECNNLCYISQIRTNTENTSLTQDTREECFSRNQRRTTSDEEWMLRIMWICMIHKQAQCSMTVCTQLLYFFQTNIYNGSEPLQHIFNNQSTKYHIIFFILQLSVNDLSRQTRHPVFLQQQTPWSVRIQTLTKVRHTHVSMVPVLQ